MKHQIINGHFFKELKKPGSFFIIRHGETFANAESRIQGRSEHYLNENGKNQASVLADFLKDKGIKRLFHSPLARASETAGIVASKLGYLQAEEELLFTELDTGSFTGLTLKEINDRFPELATAFSYKSWEAVPDAESIDELYHRACKAWNILKQAAIDSEGSVAAISHGGFIQWLFRVTFGYKSWMPLITTGNCAVFELFVKAGDGHSPVFIQWKEINLIPSIEYSGVAPVC